MEDESPCMNSCMHICFLCVCGSYQFMFLLSCTHMQMDFLEISVCVCVCVGCCGSVHVQLCHLAACL